MATFRAGPGFAGFGPGPNKNFHVLDPGPGPDFVDFGPGQAYPDAGLGYKIRVL